jgi:hypothetical protein
MKELRSLIAIMLASWAIMLGVLLSEERQHERTKAQLNSYKVKLFESAYRLNKCERDDEQNNKSI